MRYRSQKQKNSQTGRLGPKLIRTVLLTVTAAFVALFGIVASQVFLSNRSREIENQRSQLAQTAGRIQELQHTVKNIASLIVYNDVVQKGISDRADSPGNELYAARRISNTLKEYLHIIEGTEEITIYTTQGQTLTSRYVRGDLDPDKVPWFRAFLLSGKEAGFTGVHSSVPMQSGYTTDVISYVTGYYSIDGHRNKLGELIINVEYRTLENMTGIDPTMLRGYALLDDRLEPLLLNGEIRIPDEKILKNAQNGTYELGSGGLYVISDEMEDGWILVSEISGTELIRRSLNSVIPIFIIFILMLVIIAVVLRYMIRRVTDPINTLSAAAGEVGHGNFSISVDIHTDDEVEDLAEAFNRMVVDIENLMNASVEHEKKIQQMQTENLMLQINPHFIYNTMNSIVYMARMEGNTQIAEFTNAFISLLQSTLRVRSSVYTTLEEELKNVRSYLFLQSYRYGNKFTWEIDCPEEYGEARIVSVMLQPVVENAIFHGIAPKDGPGDIRIGVSKKKGTDGEQLRIEVCDDGIGMNQETLMQILSEDYVQKGGIHKIGIGNVRARIREIYADRGSLTVESIQGEGTVVTIEIPYEITHEIAQQAGKSGHSGQNMRGETTVGSSIQEKEGFR